MTKLNFTALKQIGLNYLSELGVCPEVIHAFEKHDVISLFGFSFCRACQPYGISPDSALGRRIHMVEKNGSKVFAVTRDFIPYYGLFFSFLLVSPYEQDWDETFKALGNNTYRIYAYVWNVNDDKCSEFGSVYIKAENGGLRRVG